MFWVAAVLLLLLCAASALEISARFLQLNAQLSKPKVQRQIPQTFHTDRTFVSVHVATHSEPPRLVIDTLRALANSRHSSFEVIVVDNNTVDEGLWRPVEALAHTLGARFRFYHFDQLQGAKAGALNVALELTDPRATHVAIVDADYQVDPDFLSDGLRTMRDAGVEYVQFPQAYRGVDRAARGVEEELGDYFSCFAGGAGRPGSMLPTGTLSLFSIPALHAVGGWPTKTITEDAEIGVRLQAAGYRGVWAARKRGSGLLPVDLMGLRKQRARWAAGNLQVLKHLYQTRRLRLDLGDLLNLTAQLTSWVSLLLPAAVALVLTAAFPAMPLADVSRRLAAGTILGSTTMTAIRMIVLNDKTLLAVRLEAFITKLALTWNSATAWLPALWPKPLVFHRTAKSASEAGSSADWVLAGCSAVFGLAGLTYFWRGDIWASAPCLLLASVWLCARRVDANLKHSAARNPEIGLHTGLA